MFLGVYDLVCLYSKIKIFHSELNLMNITVPKIHNYFLKDNLEKILNLLQDDGMILFPTDTIWGIGCDACNPTAIERIYRLKNRDRSKPFVLLVDGVDMLKKYVDQVPPRIETLLAHHTRPLTVIYNKGKNLPDNAMAASGSVAIRLVQDPFCKQLIHAYNRPLVATSANISEEPFPSNFGEISSDIIQGVDYVFQHRRDDRKQREPSVIVKYNEKGDLVFIRE